MIIINPRVRIIKDEEHRFNAFVRYTQNSGNDSLRHPGYVSFYYREMLLRPNLIGSIIVERCEQGFSREQIIDEINRLGVALGFDANNTIDMVNNFLDTLIKKNILIEKE